MVIDGLKDILSPREPFVMTWSLSLQTKSKTRHVRRDLKESDSSYQALEMNVTPISTNSVDIW